MSALFDWLSEAMVGSPWLAVVAAAGWGVASLVLSPCHLASIPLVVGFVSGQGAMSRRRALGCTLLFAAGIMTSLAVVGGITALLGRMLGDIGPWPAYVVALMLVVVGGHLLGLLKLPWENGLTLPERKGGAGAFLVGLVFGTALGPCTFAFIAPVLGVVFSVARTEPLYALMLLVSYAIGHCGLIVVAGLSAERVQRVLDWHGAAEGGKRMRKGCGLLLIAGAVWLAVSAR